MNRLGEDLLQAVPGIAMNGFFMAGVRPAPAESFRRTDPAGTGAGI
jgi:hypothetical protein